MTSPDLRSDPAGWIIRVDGWGDWEAVHKDHERGDDGFGRARGPVWFSGKSRTEVLDLIYAYECEHLESLRRGWIEEAREALEIIEAWLWLHTQDVPPKESVEGIHKLVKHVLESVPQGDTL